jgi:hypothetical protein
MIFREGERVHIKWLVYFQKYNACFTPANFSQTPGKLVLESSDLKHLVTMKTEY